MPQRANPQFAVSVIQRPRLPDQFTITQIDENGIVLARQPDAEPWFGRSMIGSPLFEEILSKKTGVTEIRDNGQTDFIYAFAPLQSSLRARSDYMVLVIPRHLAFADSNRILRRNLILLGFIALAAVLAAWFGSDLFVMRQIRVMEQQAPPVAEYVSGKASHGPRAWRQGRRIPPSITLRTVTASRTAWRQG